MALQIPISLPQSLGAAPGESQAAAWSYPLTKASDSTLAVLLHAYRHTPDRFASVEKAVRDAKPNAHVIVPELPLRMWSTADLDDVAAAVVALIDEQVAHREQPG